ncbi:helical backbone metal receptor [Roseateles amylovorans]|uniref:Helical backbone metal receptor n=1 Tax=Roseateles amylovorans TaxID=2978473 RepID=A0ABY6AYT2_9BURK|nr:helical backbone metal receptor [Roseateles amylovorans]UXH78344.1 helical backbone metal receptor [Roseateles amylovorans]
MVPSITELLIALGLQPWIVGRTGFCIHPAGAVAGIPKVGGTKDVNLRKLRALAPTHVIVNMDENRRETVEALRAFVPAVIVTHPCGPEDNLTLLSQLTADFADDVPPLRQAAEGLARRLGAALAACRQVDWPARRVLYLIWRAPWMTVARDTYIARMLAEVGWQTWPPVDGGSTGASRYPVLTGDEPWLADIDEVLLSSEPFPFGPAHLEEAQSLCQTARVRLIDGELISWYGPRAAEGLDYLRTLAQAPQLGL